MNINRRNLFILIPQASTYQSDRMLFISCPTPVHHTHHIHHNGVHSC